MINYEFCERLSGETLARADKLIYDDEENSVYEHPPYQTIPLVEGYFSLALMLDSIRNISSGKASFPVKLLSRKIWDDSDKSWKESDLVVSGKNGLKNLTIEAFKLNNLVNNSHFHKVIPWYLDTLTMKGEI